MAVLTLKTVPGETDDLIASTCQGMAYRASLGLIPKGLGNGEDIMEFNGKGIRNQNVNCGGFCRSATEYFGVPYQCDEYPPGRFPPRFAFV
jgi:hypothetical protein